MARSRTVLWTGRLLYAAGYAAGVTLVFGGLSAVVGLFVGLPFVGAKYGLFFVGWLAFGYGTFTLLPRPPWRDGNGRGEDGLGESLPSLSSPPSGPDPDSPTGTVVGGGDQTRFQAFVASLPPASLVPITVDERLATSIHVFVASLAMLLTSFLLEAVFGVPG